MAKKKPTRKRRLRRITERERAIENQRIQRENDRITQQFYLDILNIQCQDEETFIAEYRAAEARANRRLDSLMVRMKRIVPEDIRHPIDIADTARHLGIAEHDVKKGIEEGIKAGMFAIETDEKGNKFFIHPDQAKGTQ